MTSKEIGVMLNITSRILDKEGVKSVSASNNVKNLIEELGMKQSYVAHKIGMHPKTFNALLNGRKTFDVMYVVPICKALGISPNELLGFSDPHIIE